MQIKWLGHAAFLISSEAGIKIITDPYVTGGGIGYGEIEETADIVTVSHEHGDHNNVAAIKGNPDIVRGTGHREVTGIKINGIPSYHDDAGGSQRGQNTIFCLEVDGMKVCHLGDLGHPLGDKEVAEIGKVDVLLIPVGGFYTIDAGVATGVCDQLSPGVMIPMHYKNEKLDYPISGVDDFLKGKPGVNRLDTSEVEITGGKLPVQTQITVLTPAL